MATSFISLTSILPKMLPSGEAPNPSGDTRMPVLPNSRLSVIEEPIVRYDAEATLMRSSVRNVYFPFQKMCRTCLKRMHQI